MGAMSFAMPPLRRTLALSAAATMVATAAFAMTAVTPSAQAQAGRRLCTYVNGERTQDQKTRFVVVDYKKDGKCPPIDPEKYPELNSYVNPVPKHTCEQISAEVEFDSKYYDDLCNIMTNDTVYGVFKRDDQPLHMLDDIVDYGPVRYFG
jgi:hypothetical protein